MSGPARLHSPVDVIVVAAGASRRMEGIDKLLTPVAGRPLLAWTLDAVASSTVVERIVVVASAANIDAIRDAPWLPERVGAVVVGGDRRQGSVAAGVGALQTLGVSDEGDAAGEPLDRVILVHDGARPLLSASLIDLVARAVELHGAAIPVVPVAETVKRVVDDQVAETVDRSDLVTAQTPQGVRAGILMRAYDRFPPDGPETWTDEAALLEACRIPVHVVPGDPSNLKVTQPADLRRVESMVAGPGSQRVGVGHDSHPFGPGGPLALGGVVIEGAPRLHGHSDGDVVLHALADALLGGAGLGDLGRLFPADSRTPRGIASDELLAEVRRRVEAAGWRPVAVDLTVVAARPRLDRHLDPMRDAIAAALGLERLAVNVKASSGNLDGSEGAGRGISALAVATLAAAS